jgi:thioredoxin-like negative regulator of GroEL
MNFSSIRKITIATLLAIIPLSIPNSPVFAAQPAAAISQLPRTNSIACNPEALEFVRQGLEAEAEGDESQALEFYGQALQVDDECGYAYLFSAQIMAKVEKDLAIEFGKAAAACFAQQEDLVGLNAAIAFLTELGVEF